MEEYGRRGKGKGKDKRKGNDPEGEEEDKDVESEQKVSSRPSGKGVTDMWNIKCHKCKNWGHYARDCQYERTRESRGEVDMKMIQCYNCKKWGHYAKDCWANKADDHHRAPKETPKVSRIAIHERLEPTRGTTEPPKRPQKSPVSIV